MCMYAIYNPLSTLNVGLAGRPGVVEFLLGDNHHWLLANT